MVYRVDDDGSRAVVRASTSRISPGRRPPPHERRSPSDWPSVGAAPDPRRGLEPARRASRRDRRAADGDRSGTSMRPGVPGMLPPEEQIPGERLAVRDHIKVVIVEGRRKGPDAVVVVSRSHPQLVQRLMEQEVPELQTGQVVIRAIARDPGRRTKVAVDAPEGDVDAQGACIGRNGVRQRAVTSELGEEQVQIVAWSADPSTFVMNSLIPAVARGRRARWRIPDRAHLRGPRPALACDRPWWRECASRGAPDGVANRHPWRRSGKRPGRRAAGRCAWRRLTAG